MTEAFKNNFWLIYFKKSTLYINIIKTVTLNNHKYLYKIINIMEVKHTYKTLPLPSLHLLCVYLHTLLPQQKDCVTCSNLSVLSVVTLCCHCYILPQ